MPDRSPETPTRRIDRLILEVRGRRVLLDAHLAELYRVTTGRLNEQVARNLNRFPADFMFELTQDEWSNLISQIAISSGGHGGRRKLPRVFTEQGVAMLSSVLRSPEAVEVNIAIMRAFVRLREALSGQDNLLRRLDELEGRVGAQDARFRAVFGAIRQLIDGDPVASRRRIGFEDD